MDGAKSPRRHLRATCLVLAGFAVAGGAEWRQSRYCWPGAEGEPLAVRVAPPEGFTRLPAAPGSFAAWLRDLPLRPGRPEVRLFDGRSKGNQAAHEAVVAIEVGRRDLQQCADAVIRLRAEWLWSRGCEGELAFHFTSGHLASWGEWKHGGRPRVSGRTVTWSRTAPADSSYASFRRYLDNVFVYAGSISLARELTRVADPRLVEAGDVFIQGGSPGHAVLVADVAADEQGRRAFLLIQSYMPAQEIHLLRNPATAGSPWYFAAELGELVTPEWTFRFADLRRFPSPQCPPPE